MKINRLEETKKLYPHFFERDDDSNFVKHLKVVGNVQQDIRHKLKTIEWSRLLEKPIQIWKTQTEPYIYNMNFKVQVSYLKEINVYKNPILDDNEEIIGFEEVDNPNDELGRVLHITYEEDNVRFFERTIKDIETPTDLMIPNDTYVLEVITWDDYRFVKGYPENDYTVKEDNILQYNYNETFLSIKLEEISYSKYLTFRVHKDKIKKIEIYKNDQLFFDQKFEIEKIVKYPTITSSTYNYYDESYTNENTYLQGDYRGFYDIEDDEANNTKEYSNDSYKNEYVLRLPLTDDDVDENGVVKDIYDLTVTLYESRYHCRSDKDRIYSKRYNGYDNKINDCFDHDYSLDILGNLFNIHRFRFYQVTQDVPHLSRTYPTYYNRSTEDDYHYMRRIQFYISNYNFIIFPLLEFWKYYTIFPSLRSRKRIIGEMDNTYLRTLDSEDYICSDETLLIEEEFENEQIIEYSINKATNVNNESVYISLGDGWYESVIVKDVYIVPSTDYLLKYTVNNPTVTPRLICYNRKGKLLRSTPIVLETEDTRIDNNSIFVEKIINIPSDTSSIRIVLESNTTFVYNDAIFERIKVVDFDNQYMATEYEYNSNFYELYVNYEDIPTNIKLSGGDRFTILLKRSLPLTKLGLLYVDVTEPINEESFITDEQEFYLYNILDETQRDVTLTESENYYDECVSTGVLPNKEYQLNILFNMITEEYESENTEPINYTDLLSENQDNYLHDVLERLDILDKTMSVLLEFYDENREKILTEEEFFDDTFYSDTEAELQYRFTTPDDTSYLRLRIIAQTTTELKKIRIGRTEKLSIEEI